MSTHHMTSTWLWRVFTARPACTVHTAQCWELILKTEN